MGKVDGLIIGGGGDVDPSLYGGDRHHPTLSGVDTVRDLNENKMLNHAVQRGLPVLGICRGAQLINVLCGGTLFHDLAQELGTEVQHQGREDWLDRASHFVEVCADTRLAALLGASGSVEVNSGHHQGIAAVGEGLRVVARSPDGIVEAFEGVNDHVVLGVQWHPENLWRTQAHASRLLAGFARVCQTTGAAPVFTGSGSG
jgi:putative glutamine amidotransferase